MFSPARAAPSYTLMIYSTVKYWLTGLRGETRITRRSPGRDSDRIVYSFRESISRVGFEPRGLAIPSMTTRQSNRDFDLGTPEPSGAQGALPFLAHSTILESIVSRALFLGRWPGRARIKKFPATVRLEINKWVTTCGVSWIDWFEAAFLVRVLSIAIE